MLVFKNRATVLKEFPVILLPLHRTGVTGFCLSVSWCVAMPETFISLAASLQVARTSLAKLMCKVHEEWGMLGARQAFSLDMLTSLSNLVPRSLGNYGMSHQGKKRLG